MDRKRFPTEGIFRAQGGIADTYFLNDTDKRRYRYIKPARPDSIQPECTIADCWIVDREGRVNPGTNVSPVPFCLAAVGKRIA